MHTAKKWRIRSAAVAVLAGFLSLALVTPSVAADGWVPDSKKLPAEERYKYGYDYYKKEMGTGNSYTYKMGDKIPLSPTANPSNVGGSYYLNQVRQRALNPSNIPLTGKVIEPAKTPAKPPAVYTRYPGLTGVGGALGISRLLGTAGVGIGGVSVAPSNSREIALSQGVSTACLDNGQCTADEIKKQFSIGSCQHTGTCSTIGGLNPDGSPMENMMETLIPLAADLWAALTGQGGDKQEPINGHYNVTAPGCKVRVDFEKRDGANGTLHITQTEVKARPASGIIAQNAWDAACSSTKSNTMAALDSAVADRVITECVDPRTGLTSTTGLTPNPYGIDLGISSNGTGTFRTDGTNVSNLCDNSGYVLMKVKVYNNQPQTYFNTSMTASNTTAVEFTEWVNPDPSLDTIEDTTITTNWTCRDKYGTEHNLSRSVTKVSGFVEPSCPPGSDLVKHEVQASNPGAASRTLDGGNENPAAKTQFPDCVGTSCALSIKIDGQTCTAAVTACQTWPQVHAATPSRVQCQWGGYTLPTDNCLTLSNAYKSDTGMVFEPKSQTWTAVDIYGNPVSPNPEPWSPTNPNPTPGTQAPPTTGTGTSTPPTPGVEAGGIPTTGTNPADTCLKPTWSWNPVEWVKNPVVCALEDAFVPKQNVALRLGELKDLSMTKAPLSWMNPAMVGPGGGGCPAWVVTVPGFSQNVVCESSFTAAIVGARGPLFGLVAGAMVWPLFRSLWYAAIPILRVTPGSSK